MTRLCTWPFFLSFISSIAQQQYLLFERSVNRESRMRLTSSVFCLSEGLLPVADLLASTSCEKDQVRFKSYQSVTSYQEAHSLHEFLRYEYINIFFTTTLTPHSASKNRAYAVRSVNVRKDPMRHRMSQVLVENESWWVCRVLAVRTWNEELSELPAGEGPLGSRRAQVRFKLPFLR